MGSRENKKADTLSRLTDMDDWSVDDEFLNIMTNFGAFVQLTGTCNILLQKLVRFNIKY